MFTKNESLNQNLFYDNIQLNQIHTVGRNKVKVMNVRFYQQSYTSLTEPACKEWLKSVEDIYRFVLDLSHIMCNSKPASKPPTGQASENIQGF